MIKVKVLQTPTVSVSVGKITTGGGGGEPYIGPYTYTPTPEAQTIPINGKVATQDITVNPIPSNYGLITYNGFEITVS